MPLFSNVIGHSTPRLSRTRSTALRLATAQPRIEAMESRILLAMPTLWTPTGPGGGGATLWAEISPNGQDLWTCSDMSGIYHSRNFGQSWQMVNFHNSIGGVNGGANSQVVFTSDPNVLYIGPTNAGPVKSTDDGATWTALSGWTYGTAIWIGADPSTTTNILGCDGTNLYFSSNGGTSFTTAYSSSNLAVGGAFFDGSNVYVGSNKGFLTSSNGGSTFTLSAQQPATANIMSFTGAKQGSTVRLLALTTSDSFWDGYSPRDLTYNGLYRLDVGGSWVNGSAGVRSGETPYFVAMAQGNITVAYLGGGDPNGRPDVLKSTDGGVTWNDTFFTRPSDVPTNIPNANIATASEGQGGDFDWSWGGPAYGFSVCPTDVNKAIISEAWVHLTSDGGTTWHQVYENQANSNPMGQLSPQHEMYTGVGLTMTSAHYLTWTSPTDIMAGYTDINGAISTNGGVSWSFPTWNGAVTNTLYKTIYSGGMLYGATSNVHDMYQSTHLTDATCNPSWQTGAVVVSADQGATWSPTPIHSFGVPVIWIQLDPNNANRMYACAVDGVGSNGGIWVTSNLNLGAASTWTKLANPPRTQGHAYILQVLNDGTLVATYSGRMAGNVFTDSSGVFVSTDGGATWTDRTGPTMHWYTMQIAIDPTDPTQNTWYAGVFNAWGGNGNGMGDLYRTTDRGVTWTRMNLAGVFGVPYPDVSSVTINAGTKEMYVVSGNAGLAYAPDVTVPGFSAANITNVTSFPFAWNERAFINPYNSQDVWVAAFGGGLIEGGVGPSNLAATAVNSSQINLSWADNSSNETGFAIDRATDPAFTQNLVTTTAGQNATVASITGLNPTTLYYFRVRATNGPNASANSNPASAITLAPGPAAPSGLSATVISQTQISLSWTDNSSNEDGFYLDRSTDSSFTTNLVTTPVAANVMTFNATGLSSGTTYYFQVRAYNAISPSPNSNTASATTLVGLPVAPSALTATAMSQAQINLSWTDNSNNELGFYVDRSTDSGFAAIVVTTPVGANVTTLSVTGLSSSTTYYFQVRAYNDGGLSGNSAPASATTLDYPPSVPSGLSATVISFSQINLSWTDNSSNEMGFYLDRATNSGFSSNLVTSTIPANTTTFDAMGLLPNTTYYFQVRAYGSGGPSANSNTASATTLQVAPLAPSGLVPTVISQTQIDLSWTDNSSNEDGFYIDRASDSGFSSNVLTSTVGANVRILSAMGLSPSNTYYFRVRAYNSVGPSANSAPASATTLPNAPSGLNATVTSQTQINLSWTDNSSDEIGFYIDRASDSAFSTNLITSAVGANVTTFNATGLTSASTYYFRLRAYNLSAPSANSASASATTLHYAPTDIALDNASVPENQPWGTLVGNLSSTDPDAGDSFTYSLVSGSGSEDNASFSIAGTQLVTAEMFNYEAKNSYSIRIRSTDAGGMAFEKAFVIAVSDVNDPPTDITLDNASVPENQPAGTVVGTLSSTDEDAGDSFSYSLVDGEGSTDNSSFTISGDQLQTTESFDYEVKTSYSIRVQTTDAGGLSYEKIFTIAVTNVNEPPTDIELSNASVPEDQPIGTLIGVLSGVSSNAGDTFSYALVSGTNSEDNSSFQINDDQLGTAMTFNYLPERTYAVRIRATASTGLWVEKEFTIDVSSLPEFGLTGGKKAVSLSTVDDDGDMVTFKLSGGGLGALWGNQLSLIGTTSKSVLTISVKRSRSGDGQYLVGGISSDGLIKAINAKGVVLGGEVLLNNLDRTAAKTAVSLKFLQVVDGGIESQDLPIKSLSLLDWQDSDGVSDPLRAPSIGSISVKGRKASSMVTGLPGDLDADVSVSGGIKSIRVAGTLAGDVTVGTTIGSIKTGHTTGTITQGGAKNLSTSSVVLLQDGGILGGVLPSLAGTFADPSDMST